MEKVNISNELKKYSKELSDLDGISAHEGKIVNYIKNSLSSEKNLKFERDGLGSLAVIKESKNPNAPTISFTAHMDEVGFMVTKIDDKGFVWFTPVGGWWGHVLLAQLLKITTNSGKEVVGVVGSTPPHLLKGPEAKQVIKVESMFIDIGANSKKEAEDLGIEIGNPITPKTIGAFEILNDRIVAKAHDDRISVAVGIAVMKEIANLDLEANVIFVASVQEEVGLRGARTSSYKWTPDIGFAVDVTIANDTPGLPPRDTKLGTGPALSMFDYSIIANPKLLQYTKEVAKANKIPFTYDSLTGGGTDAGLIHLAKDGVIAMTISIPSRYMHSHNSIIDLKDASLTVKLLTSFVKDFKKEDLETLTYK